MKLTKATVAALTVPAGKAEHIVWDEDMPGFGVRLRGDSQRWICQYRVGHQQRRETLGDPRKVRLEDARKIAQQRFARVELGADPVAEKAEALAEAGQTLGVVADRYMEIKKGEVRPNTYKLLEHDFRVYWEPLRKRPLTQTKRAEVAARLEELAKENGRVAAKNARGNLNALYGWAMQMGLCETNPVIGTRNPADGIPVGQRVLSDEEIRIVWNACNDDDYGRILKLHILTGCRRLEISKLERSEVVNGVLQLIGGPPRYRTKNGYDLTLGLPPLTLSILESAPQRREGAKYFFPRLGRNGEEVPYGAWQFDRISLDERIERHIGRKLPHWKIHDLRRTCRTGLGRIGIRPDVAELVINHVKGGIQAVYDKARYQGEINAALADWAEFVLAVVEGDSSTIKFFLERGGKSERDSKIVPLRHRATPVDELANVQAEMKALKAREDKLRQQLADEESKQELRA
jgi:hypothetical protein